MLVYAIVLILVMLGHQQSHLVELYRPHSGAGAGKERRCQGMSRIPKEPVKLVTVPQPQ